MTEVDFDLKLKLNWKRLYLTKSVKYFDTKIDWEPYLEEHINHVPIKLNRANALLYKVRGFVNTRVLKLICHAIFDCKYRMGSKQKFTKSLILFIKEIPQN